MKRLPNGFVLLFTVTIFLSAALLFLSELMVAKLLLPLFGGSAGVWNTCMMFFQAALLLGYLYAHWSVQKLGLKRQPVVHGVLVLLPLVMLPFALPGWAGTDSSPILNILATLTVTVGAPFLVLATSGPLLQRWFAATKQPHAKQPYFLYAASNFGSFLALLAYPFAAEPLLSLGDQTRLWAVGYGLFAVLTITCIVLFQRQAKAAPAALKPAMITPWRTRLAWLLLAALPSSLLLGVTGFVTTDVAAIPLLWVVPLALYLLTFVIAFGVRKPASLARELGLWTAAALPAIAVLAVLPNRLESGFLIAAYIIVFFVVALAAHARLSADRPEPARLTEFYLWVAAGGVLGGAFNSLVAPLIFNNAYELPLALLLAVPLVVSWRQVRSAKRPALGFAALLGTLAAAVLVYLWHATDAIPAPVLLAVAIIIPCAAYMTRWFRPAVFAAALVPILATPLVVLAIQPSIYTERTFYGVFTVSRENGMHVLTHGATYHGSQFEDDELAKEPTSYYNRQGPLGDAVEACRKLTGCKRIGVIGLGTGSIAAYGQPGDDMTFYEIDPAIIDIAKDSRFFSYLSDSQAQVRTVPGDGRLSLAADDAKYDLLVIDAFSSDAIPMHLLTTEALGLYKTKLNPGGLLALHISNRNLLLEPIVQAGAKAQHMEALTRYDPGRQSPEGLHLASLWMVLAPEPKDLNELENRQDWQAAQDRQLRAWTDDYSNLLEALPL